MKLRSFRALAVAAGIVMAVSGFASFELLLVSDLFTNSVHRFDGTTGTYFGSFGAGRLSGPVGVAVDSAKGLAYISSNLTSTVQVYEYSTGVFRDEFLVGPSARGLAILGSSLYMGCSNGINQYTTSGSLVRTFGTGTYNDVHIGSDGAVYGYSVSRSAVERFTPSGAAAGTFTPAADTASYPHWMGAAVGGRFYLTNSQTRKLEIITEGASMTSLGTYTTTGVDQPRAIALGHGLSAYVGGFVPGGTAGCQIIPISLVTGRPGTAFGASALRDIGGMASVVAPEPSGLVGLLVGVAAIMSRRRSCHS